MALTWRRQWQPTAGLLPGKSHWQRSLVGCSPWGCEESDTTEWLHFHFSLSCIGEGNGNPLQCSCLENPRDREAWWAAIYGVAQSWTRLKQLSSSSTTVGPSLFIFHLESLRHSSTQGVFKKTYMKLWLWKSVCIAVFKPCLFDFMESLRLTLNIVRIINP